MNETTHYEGCYDSGPKHYECALLEVKKLRGESEANIGSLGMPVNVAVSPRREWVSLTDEDIKDIMGRSDSGGIGAYTRKIFKQIEDKLREKNGG
jgi:hypothetical protein